MRETDAEELETRVNALTASGVLEKTRFKSAERWRDRFDAGRAFWRVGVGFALSIRMTDRIRLSNMSVSLGITKRVGAAAK